MKHVILVLILSFYSPQIADLLRSFASDRNIIRSDTQDLGIARIISQVRDNLYQAAEESKSKYPADLFALKTMELDLSFIIKSKHGKKQGSDVELIAVQSETEYSREQVQRIKLTMEALKPEKITIPPLEHRPAKGDSVAE